MSRKTIVIVVITFLAIVATFSACTLVVSHERDSLIRAAESGSGSARLLMAGANFWDRYFVFFIIAFVSFGFLILRLAASRS